MSLTLTELTRWRRSACESLSARATLATTSSEIRCAVPVSNIVYHVIPTPASAATSSRRNPATRRRSTDGKFTSSGRSRARRLCERSQFGSTRIVLHCALFMTTSMPSGCGRWNLSPVVVPSRDGWLGARSLVTTVTRQTKRSTWWLGSADAPARAASRRYGEAAPVSNRIRECNGRARRDGILAAGSACTGPTR